MAVVVENMVAVDGRWAGRVAVVVVAWELVEWHSSGTFVGAHRKRDYA